MATTATATATKERPILFSGPMVRALLDGRKTQTRRVVKPQPPEGVCRCPYAGGWAHEHADGACSCRLIRCPYGWIGDRLWVREAWGLMDTQPSDGPDRATLGYRADGDAAAPNGRHQLWRPSIHMPRWASRITLEITDVRVERLQDISEDDAWAEGFPDPEGANREYPDRARYWFRNLWGEINGKGSWDMNPWVWALTFRRVES